MADEKPESQKQPDKRLPLPEPKEKCPICKKELGFMGWCSTCRIKIM